MRNIGVWAGVWGVLGVVACGGPTEDPAAVAQAVTETPTVEVHPPEGNTIWFTLRVVATPGAIATFYEGPGCTGAAIDAADFWPDGTVVRSFTLPGPAPENRLHRYSVAVDGQCLYAAYRHDDVPPAPPVLTLAAPPAQGAWVRGGAEPDAMVELYDDESCRRPITAPARALGGEFYADLDGYVPENLFARAVDRAGNASPCVFRHVDIAFTENLVPLQECTNLPASVPPSRPPVLATLGYYPRFRPWYDSGCDADGCPAESAEGLYRREIDEDRPALHGIATGSHATFPFHWGMGATRQKASDDPNDMDAVLDCTTGCTSWEEAGPPTSKQLTIRVEYLKHFNAIANKTGAYAPYIDLSTQFYGNPALGLGLWNFMDQWDEYTVDFGLGSALAEFDPPGAPFDGFRLPCWASDIACPAQSNPLLLGYKFAYNPTAGPVFRWAGDVTNPDFERWQKLVMANAARAGHRFMFLDNAYGAVPFNARGEAYFADYLTEHHGSTRLADRSQPNLIPYGDCETWIPNMTQSCVAMAYPQAGSYALPDLDSYGGNYSIRLGNPNPGAQWYTPYYSATGLVVGDLYHLRFAYRASPGSTLSVVSPQSLEIIPSGGSAPSWQTFDWWFPATATSQQVIFAVTGEVWLDEILIEPRNGYIDQPFDHCAQTTGSDGHYRYEGRLPHAEEGGGWDYSCFWPRLLTSQNAAWQRVDELVETMRDAARSEGDVPGLEGAANADFMVNSPRPIRGASWNLIESGTFDGYRAVDEVVLNPGLYPAGAKLPAGRVLPADEVLTNAFMWRHTYALKSELQEEGEPLGFVRPVFKPVKATIDANGDHYFKENVDTTLLTLAQGAAFAGGAGIMPGFFYVHSELAAVYDIGYCEFTDTLACTGRPSATRDPYRETIRGFFDNFVNGHPDLFSCRAPRADVVMVLGRTGSFDQRTPNVVRLFEKLLARGYLVDVHDPLQHDLAANARLILLYGTANLSEDDAAFINQHVANGAAVLATEDAARHDELGRLRLANPNTLWTPPPYVPNPPPDRHWTLPAAQTVAGGSGTDVDRAVAAVDTAMQTYFGYTTALPDLDPALAAKVRLAAWANETGVVVHILNYAVTRGYHLANAAHPITTPFTVSVSLPAGSPIPATAYLYAPETPLEPPIEVPVTIAPDGRASFTLPVSPTSPALRIYRIAELRF